MSQSVKLKDGSYIDASGVYDATQGKTQESINASKQNHIKFVQQVGYADGTYTRVKAPTVDGYTFLIWTNPYCTDHLGAPFIGNPDAETCTIWDGKYSDTTYVGHYGAWALYVKND